MLADGRRIIVPAIVCYEVRRELIRAGKTDSLIRLDLFCDVHEYSPLTDTALRRAADLWAQVRKAGKPTTPDLALDGDVILAAQVLELGEPNAVIATTNPSHLLR